jgi:hypothetical protein
MYLHLVFGWNSLYEINVIVDYSDNIVYQ